MENKSFYGLSEIFETFKMAAMLDAYMHGACTHSEQQISTTANHHQQQQQEKSCFNFVQLWLGKCGTLSLSLSLSHTHTHTHTVSGANPPCLSVTAYTMHNGEF